MSTMAVPRGYAGYWLRGVLVVVCALCWTSPVRFAVGQTGQLSVDASPQTARKIPDKMFGIFFEVRLREQFLIQ
jgi:alpha-N-arabinofuranosidase